MNTLNRRAALGGIASLAAVAPAMAIQIAPSGLTARIKAHRNAVAIADERWDAFSVVSEANPGVALRSAKVQIGRLLLGGKDDDGNDRWKPMYAFTDKDIDKVVDRDKALKLSWSDFQIARNPSVGDQIAQAAEDRRARLKADLLAQQEDIRRAEDACGITAAHEAALAASAVVAGCLEAILLHKPASLLEVTQAAEYLVDCNDRGVEGFDDETFVRLAKTLAGREVAS